MVYAPALPVETERLTLRPFTRADVEAVFAYRRLPEVARYLFDEPMSRETVTEAIQVRVGQTVLMEDGDRLFLAVEHKADRTLIGEVSLVLRSVLHGQAELGYIFHPAVQGHGFATEAARALLRLGFHGAGMHRIYARCTPDNTRSWRVMERLGMVREAHLREHAFIKGAWEHELIYGLLEGEWQRQLAKD